MRLRSAALSMIGALALAACSDQTPAPVAPANVVTATSSSGSIGINVLLKSAATAAQLTELGSIGTVTDQISQLNALSMRISSGDLSRVQALPYVAYAGPDAERKGAPIDAVSATDFANGFSTWDQDAINVTVAPLSSARAVPQTGQGVYVGVLDTGLLDSWRQYFPEERIAEEYGIAFGGGGGEVGSVSSQPEKWEHDQNSHGTHVTSTILGFRFGTTNFNGTAPLATVIPVKVLNQNGSGWSSVVAHGIVYIADLKQNQLGGAPVVINMSLGGSVLDAVEKAAVDYAIKAGVIVVASAGNEGESGMGYPGAYAPVISVAAAGWRNQFQPCPPFAGSTWWRACDVPEVGKKASSYTENFYIADFSSREKAGQDLDVVAPGAWVVGPYQLNSSQPSYFYLSGTSMSSPHVAGIAALMAQKKPSLTGPQAETILESTAIPMGAGTAPNVINEGTLTWGTDATGSGFVTADRALAATN
jgi:subtilisin family serine protease